MEQWLRDALAEEQENKKLESDLYEANNRIKDLLEESEE